MQVEDAAAPQGLQPCVPADTLTTTDSVVLEPPPWDNFGLDLRVRLGNFALLQTFIMHQGSVDGVSVVKHDGTAPTVWR